MRASGRASKPRSATSAKTHALAMSAVGQANSAAGDARAAAGDARAAAEVADSFVKASAAEASQQKPVERLATLGKAVTGLAKQAKRLAEDARGRQRTRGDACSSGGCPRRCKGRGVRGKSGGGRNRGRRPATPWTRFRRRPSPTRCAPRRRSSRDTTRRRRVVRRRRHPEAIGRWRCVRRCPEAPPLAGRRGAQGGPEERLAEVSGAVPLSRERGMTWTA